MAEFYYARGLANNSANITIREMQQAFDDEAQAGYLYPYFYLFRTAQAKQLAHFSDHIPGLDEAASQAMRYALEVDGNSIELLGAYFVLEARQHHCQNADWARGRLKRLAPRNARVKIVTDTPCS